MTVNPEVKPSLCAMDSSTVPPTPPSGYTTPPLEPPGSSEGDEPRSTLQAAAGLLSASMENLTLSFEMDPTPSQPRLAKVTAPPAAAEAKHSTPAGMDAQTASPAGTGDTEAATDAVVDPAHHANLGQPKKATKRARRKRGKKGNGQAASAAPAALVTPTSAPPPLPLSEIQPPRGGAKWPRPEDSASIATPDAKRLAGKVEPSFAAKTARMPRFFLKGQDTQGNPQELSEEETSVLHKFLHQELLKTSTQPSTMIRITKVEASSGMLTLSVLGQ